MTATFTDKAGQPLAPGDLIVYGHALGRCAGLQYGKVLAVLEPRAGNREVVPRVRVQGFALDDNYLGHELEWTPYRAGSTRLLKPAVLTFPSRILKIERYQVPAAVLAALDAGLVSEPAA